MPGTSLCWDNRPRRNQARKRPANHLCFIPSGALESGNIPGGWKFPRAFTQRSLPMSWLNNGFKFQGKKSANSLFEGH
jgi:hypothetical protein